MIKFLILFLALCLSVIAPAAAQDGGKTAEAHEKLLQSALYRGQKIFRYDQAAEYAADAMFKDIKNVKTSGIKGRIVTETPSGLQVTFWRHDGDSFSGVYSATWNKGGISSGGRLAGDAAKLSDLQISLIKAHLLAAKTKAETCGKDRYNVALLPPVRAGDAILVYFLRPQKDVNSAPFGRHFGMAVRDGKVIARRTFGEDCSVFPLISKSIGGRAKSLNTTNIARKTPTEIHVFLAHLTQIPILVRTPRSKSRWKVALLDGKAGISRIK